MRYQGILLVWERYSGCTVGCTEYRAWEMHRGVMIGCGAGGEREGGSLELLVGKIACHIGEDVQMEGGK